MNTSNGKIKSIASRFWTIWGLLMYSECIEANVLAYLIDFWFIIYSFPRIAYTPNHLWHKVTCWSKCIFYL